MKYETIINDYSKIKPKYKVSSIKLRGFDNRIINYEILIYDCQKCLMNTMIICSSLNCLREKQYKNDQVIIDIKYS